MLEPFGEAVDFEAFGRLGRLVFAPADRLGDTDGRDPLRIGLGDDRIRPADLVERVFCGIAADDPPSGDGEDDGDDYEADGELLQDPH